MSGLFKRADDRAGLESGSRFTPNFDENGLITAICAHADSGELLMIAYMNDEALAQTLRTGEAWYWSRSRGKLWHKGATSGTVQRVVEMRVDCDQDAILLKVIPRKAAGTCHTGRASCFYRKLEIDGSGEVALQLVDQR